MNFRKDDRMQFLREESDLAGKKKKEWLKKELR